MIIRLRVYFGFMNVAFADEDLDTMETEARFTGKWDQAIVKKYRRIMQSIRVADDERELYAHRSFHFERLKGDRKGQHSLKINDQWRLIVELKCKGAQKIVRIVEIVDYH